MNFTVVIPARFASTRLPGKPLLDLCGKPMIQRVYEQALKSSAQRVVIATDDARIEAAAKSFGAEVVMTRADHPSGTDRLQEVCQHLKLDDDALLVNVQGDEPLIPPQLIDQLAAELDASARASLASLCERIGNIADFLNPNIVKVVMDDVGRALYFSRAPIPWPRDAFNQPDRILPTGLPCFRHIGMYAYRARFLHQYVTWPLSELERFECLEQLRALSHGCTIQMAEASVTPPAGVDTEQDLQRVRDLLSGQAK